MIDHDSSGIEDDEPLGPLLVHDPVSALSASDGVSRTDLVLRVALAANVDHGLLWSTRAVHLVGF